MAQQITKDTIEDLARPEKGNRIEYDSEVPGFGVRITAAGAVSFIVNYRTRSGLERRYTIGSYPAWKIGAARKEAAEIRRRVRYEGFDPLADLTAEREAPTIGRLCERFKEEHLPSKRPSTQRDYEAIIDDLILPTMKHKKVAEISHSDVDALHRKISREGAHGKPTPFRANRTVAVLSKMFSLAIRWGWRADNPTRGLARNQEEKRHRYLGRDELDGLIKALAVHKDKQAADIVRLLLLTGARKAEVLSARWADLDLTGGVWTKPGATTKQKTLHRVPLSAPARQLLVDLEASAKPDAEYVFPGRLGGCRIEIKRAWAELCVAADIVTRTPAKDAKGRDVVIVTPSARIHDLRHSFASYLASSGISLPVIGALLGHTQPATTARYAHLLDDPLKQATERAAAFIAGKDSADVHDIGEGRA
ncbi:MAG TPA: tyrosine-type recombinase/integrase [Caulobacteraceae bacterium]|nr:tyrosine-type recombinase/integrase [Caulobacteraceae bacterium]